jgi:tRNA A-37 threonylcarbamoyl transferase component Bud32
MTRLVGPPTSSSPAPTGEPRSLERALPDDLLREASRRLGIMSLMGAVLWMTAWILNRIAMRVMSAAHPMPGGLDTDDYVSLAGVLFSIALYLYTRKSRRPPAFMLDLGLWYLVLIAAAIGSMWHGTPPEGDIMPIFPMFTWIGPLVLMFAAIIPAAPRKMLGFALLAVSMGPLGMFWARARGLWDFADGEVLLMHYPDYLLALVAPVISLVVTRLGQQVSRAREMGSYRVGELIGRGGMGEVYRATHRMLARPAAIKLIRPEMIAQGDSQAAQLAVRRFRREAEVAANLRSPHTVALYDFGTTGDGALYFVMELLEGFDLERLVRTHGPLPPERTIHLLTQVCESLEEAHSLGLVHRDIKPANIHVGRLGLRHDFVKVLDFGLVKSVDTRERAAPQTAETAAGITPGTPDYMAPEMTLGNTVDARADLYAIGCVGYFMLTGEPVFKAANVYHMIARHLNDEPVPPSERSGRPIPPLLESLILACLRKDPDQRPQRAADIARGLAAVPLDPWGEDQAEAWWRQHAETAPSLTPSKPAPPD